MLAGEIVGGVMSEGLGAIRFAVLKRIFQGDGAFGTGGGAGIEELAQDIGVIAYYGGHESAIRICAVGK